MRKSVRYGLVAGAIIGGLGISAVAVALPWDLDMVDSQARKAYSCWKEEIAEDGTRHCVQSMRTLPDGVVSQPNPMTPNPYTVDYDKMDPAWASIRNPIAATPETLANGEKLFGIYCAPCHGNVVDGKIAELGTVAKAGLPAVAMLTGEKGVLQSRSDGHVYRVIRKGNAIMPAYGWALTDSEAWSIVHYSRTLDHGAYRGAP